MDYAFTPGGTKGMERSFQSLLEVRPNTTVIQPKGADPGSVNWFVKTGLVSPLFNVPNPLGSGDSLVIAGHASKTGTLSIPIDGKISESIDYETLEAALESPNQNLIRIPFNLFPANPDGGANLPLPVHIIGCSIGRSPELLALLQRGLGRVEMTAPLYAHYVYSMPRNARLIWLEYMAYEFSQHYFAGADGKPVDAATKPLTRKTLVADFEKNTAHTLIDKTPVPKANWNLWVPNPLPAKNAESKSAFPVAFDPAWGVQPAVATLSDGLRLLWAEEVPIIRQITGGKPKDPPAERRKFVKTALLKEAKFQNQHPYPVYKRHGFATLDALMDAYDWVSPDADDMWLAKRITYTLTVPITKPGTPKQLICNYYPEAGGGSYKEGMKDTDTLLYFRKPAPP